MNVLVPTVTPVAAAVTAAPRSPSLRGLRIGFMHNTKLMSDVLLEEIATRLEAGWATASVFAGKAMAGRIASGELLDQLSSDCHGIVTGVGD